MTINSSSFSNNTAKDGGAIFIGQSAQVIIAYSTMAASNAVTGGAVSCNDGGTVTIASSSLLLFSNASVGGGVYASGSCQVLLKDGVSILNGTAQQGAGIALVDAAVLSAADDSVVIMHNAAHKTAGGVYSQSPNFVSGDLATTVRNNTAQYNPNTGVIPTTMSVVGDSNVGGFVSRLGASSQSSLPVAVNVSGYQSLPVEGALVQCVLVHPTNHEPLFLGVNRSLDSGVAYLGLRVQQPPGDYVLSCTLPDAEKVAAANISLQVRGESIKHDSRCQHVASCQWVLLIDNDQQ